MKIGFIKTLLVVGLVFTIIGGIVFSVAMTINGWDFSVLSSHVAQKRVVEIVDQEEINSITSVKVEFSTADVAIAYHDNEKITVDGFDLAKRNGKVVEKLSVKIINGQLVLSFEKQNPLMIQIGSWGKSMVTVKLPKHMVVDLSVKVSTGDVAIGEKGQAIAFNNVSVKTSTGDVIINGNVQCSDLSITNSTGETYVNGTLTANKIIRNADTGDMIINAKITAQSIKVTNSTGDVICSAYITANLIDVETSTGDITLKLLGNKNDYSYTYDIDTGKSNISSFTGGAKQVKVVASTGDANIYFEK